jgi:hypothetical protein
MNAPVEDLLNGAPRCSVFYLGHWYALIFSEHVQELTKISPCPTFHNPRSCANVCCPSLARVAYAYIVYRTKCEDGALFLGDGSLAGVPTPKLGQKGIRPVIKVLDDKCLFVPLSSPAVCNLILVESSILLRTIQSHASRDQSCQIWERE